MNTQRKLVFALALAALAPGLASGETDGASTAAVYACAGTEDDAARLACYDAAVGRLKAAEEAGEITTITREEVENVQRDTFGLSLPSLPAIAMPRLGGDRDEDGQLDTIAVAVTDIRRNAYGKVVITLENGQVWVQTDRGQVRFRNPETALVRRAALGSFMMQLDEGRLFRVERLR